MFETLTANGWQDVFSTMGKDMFLAKGIFHWTGRAKAEADIDATIGSAAGPLGEIIDGAQGSGLYCLPVLADALGTLTPQDLAAYAPISGIPDFRDQWKQWIVRKSGDLVPLEAEQLTRPIVIPGITAGLYLVGKLFLDPGQSIVLPDKRWGNYDAVYTRNLGIKIRTFQQFSSDAINYAAMEEALVEVLKTQDHAVTVVNFPNNPTGFMPQKYELEGVAQTLAKVAENTGRKIVVICDDAYEGFVFDKQGAKASPFYLMVGVHENVVPIKLDGLSKEFFLYGGRVGALTAGLATTLKDRAQHEAEWEDKVSGLIRSTFSNSPRAQQQLWVNVMKDRLEEAMGQRGRILEVLGARCRALQAAYDEQKKTRDLPIETDPFNSGFFAFWNLPKEMDASAVADLLLKEYKTGIIPISKPAENINGVRVAFCSVTESRIPELARNIFDAVERMGA